MYLELFCDRGRAPSRPCGLFTLFDSAAHSSCVVSEMSSQHLALHAISSRHVGRHETSIDGGGEQAHRSLKQRGSPPLESRGSKHPPQTRRPQPLRPPSRRAGPRAVAAPSPAFSSRKVSQITHFNLGTCIRIHVPGAGARAPGGQVLVRKPAFRVHLISRIKSIIIVHTLSRVTCYGPQIFL